MALPDLNSYRKRFADRFGQIGKSARKRFEDEPVTARLVIWDGRPIYGRDTLKPWVPPQRT